MIHPSEAISAYLDGELRPTELIALIDHLSSCGRCAAELEEMQQIRAAVRSLPLLELPTGVVPEADAIVVPLHRNRGVWLGTAAAVIAAVIAVAAILTPDRPSVSVQDLNSRFAARSTLDPAFGPAKVVVPDFVVGE
jgi:anti-sigma factor RsiW